MFSTVKCVYGVDWKTERQEMLKRDCCKCSTVALARLMVCTNHSKR